MYDFTPKFIHLGDCASIRQEHKIFIALLLNNEQDRRVVQGKQNKLVAPNIRERTDRLERPSRPDKSESGFSTF